MATNHEVGSSNLSSRESLKRTARALLIRRSAFSFRVIGIPAATLPLPFWDLWIMFGGFFNTEQKTRFSVTPHVGASPPQQTEAGNIIEISQSELRIVFTLGQPLLTSGKFQQY